MTVIATEKKNLKPFKNHSGKHFSNRAEMKKDDVWHRRNNVYPAKFEFRALFCAGIAPLMENIASKKFKTPLKKPETPFKNCLNFSKFLNIFVLRKQRLHAALLGLGQGVGLGRVGAGSVTRHKVGEHRSSLEARLANPGQTETNSLGVGVKIFSEISQFFKKRSCKKIQTFPAYFSKKKSEIFFNCEILAKFGPKRAEFSGRENWRVEREAAFRRTFSAGDSE